jgi:hypothetical protein
VFRQKSEDFVDYATWPAIRINFKLREMPLARSYMIIIRITILIFFLSQNMRIDEEDPKNEKLRKKAEEQFKVLGVAETTPNGSWRWFRLFP